MDSSVSFRILVTKAEYEDLWKQDDQLGLTVGEVESVKPAGPLVEARFLEYFVVAIVGTLAGFALALAKRWLRQKDNGILLDLSKDPHVISLVRNIPYGTIILTDKQGKSSVHRIDESKDLNQLESFIQDLLKMGLSV